MNADLLRLPKPAVEQILGWCAETSLLAAVLVVVAMLADRWRRPTLGPAARHMIWLVVLVKLMMPPMISWPWSRPWTSPMELAKVAPIAPAPVLLPPTLAELMENSPAEEIEPETSEFVRIDSEAKAAESPVVLKPVIVAERPVELKNLGRLAVGLWLCGSLIVALRQAWRIGRFHRRTHAVASTPDWLIDEAAVIAECMSVRLPEIRVVAGLQSPLLWCLGRPVLLVPEKLVKTLGIERWRCVLAHELAHLRRSDHWVSRLDLAAGILWWWNPLYWLARHRINAEAELACDAWVVATLPKDRLTYAESLIRICSALSLAPMPAPSVGVAGSGRYFERRLTMILKDRVSNRLSAPTLLAALLLLVLALPSWTIAKSANPLSDDEKTGNAAVRSEVAVDSSAPSDEQSAPVADDDDDDDDKDDADEMDDADDDDADEDNDDADDDQEKAAKKDAEKQEKAEKREKAEKKEKAEKPERKPKKAAKVRVKSADAEKEAAIEKIVKDALGPDFEKKMKALGEEMEKKFGPGSEFEKEMKALGGDMEKKFGPGSDFEKQMKALGEEMEKKFGPGSDFHKKIGDIEEKTKSIQRKMEADIQKNANEVSKKMKDKIKAEKAEKAETRSENIAKAKSNAKANAKAKRVKMIEDKIRQLSEELKKLQAEEADEANDKEDNE